MGTHVQPYMTPDMEYLDVYYPETFNGTDTYVLFTFGYWSKAVNFSRPINFHSPAEAVLWAQKHANLVMRSHRFNSLKDMQEFRVHYEAKLPAEEILSESVPEWRRELKRRDVGNPYPDLRFYHFFKIGESYGPLAKFPEGLYRANSDAGKKFKDTLLGAFDGALKLYTDYARCSRVWEASKYWQNPVNVRGRKRAADRAAKDDVSKQPYAVIDFATGKSWDVFPGSGSGGSTPPPLYRVTTTTPMPRLNLDEDREEEDDDVVLLQVSPVPVRRQRLNENTIQPYSAPKFPPRDKPPRNQGAELEFVNQDVSVEEIISDSDDHHVRNLLAEAPAPGPGDACPANTAEPNNNVLDVSSVLGSSMSTTSEEDEFTYSEHPNLCVTFKQSRGKLRRTDMVNTADQRADELTRERAMRSLTRAQALDGHRRRVLGDTIQVLFPPCALGLDQQRPALQTYSPPPVKRSALLQGLTWYTPGILNSCNMDSFLSYLLIRTRFHPNYLERNLLIPGNGPEGALRTAIQQHLRSRADRTARDTELKRIFIRVNHPRWDRQLETTGTTDTAASEVISIHEPLRDSARLTITLRCECGDGPDLVDADSILEVEDRTLHSWTPEQMHNVFGHYARGPVDPTKPKSSGSAKIYDRLPNCPQHCGRKLFRQHAFVPDTTFFLRFEFNPSHHELLQFDVNDNIPLEIRVPEAYRPNEFATFFVGYIALGSLPDRRPGAPPVSSQVTHQTALMHFFGRWFYYDDMVNNGVLVPVPDPNILIQTRRLTILSVTYFRL